MRRVLLVTAACLGVFARSAPGQCGGVQRWAVKMGADPSASMVDVQNPIASSLHQLVHLDRPTLPGDDVTRVPAERSVRIVDAHLLKFKHEKGKKGDRDFHLVITDETFLFSPSGKNKPASPHSLIAEVVDPDCVGGAHDAVTGPSRFATQIADVRSKFLQQFPNIKSDWNEVGGIPVRLTGVVFFDHHHGQVGRALNGLELHPLLDIEFNPALAPPAPTPGPIPAPALVAPAIANAGFEEGNTGWTATADVITTSPDQNAHQGQGKAWLGGIGEPHTDRLSQQVTLPATAHAISLAFFLHIDTEEDNQAAFDKLVVRIRGANGQFLKQLGVFTNLQAGPGFALRSFDLTQFKGRTIRIELEAKEDDGSTTSFVVDDFAIVVEP
jgi:hypothetical protein